MITRLLDGPGPDASAPTPAPTSSGSTSGSPATASRSATRTSPSRSPAIADLEVLAGVRPTLLRDRHRGGLPLVRRRRRRRRGGRGRPARPVGRHQRRRRPGRGRHQHRASTTPSSPARRSADIAREKAGIIKPGSHARARRDRSGAGRPSSAPPAADRRASAATTSTTVEQPARRRRPAARPAHADDDLPRRVPAAARRATRATTPSLALTAVEAFFAAPLGARRRGGGLRRASGCPGRFEVLGHQPLVIVDGAHNPPGADTLRAGVLRRLRPRRAGGSSWSACSGRDPTAMLDALRADEFDVVIACTAAVAAGHPGRATSPRRRARSAATRSSSPTTVERRLRRGAAPAPTPTTRSSSPARSTSSAPPARPARCTCVGQRPS